MTYHVFRSYLDHSREKTRFCVVLIMEENLDYFIKSVEDKLANHDSRITSIDFNAKQCIKC